MKKLDLVSALLECSKTLSSMFAQVIYQIPNMYIGFDEESGLEIIEIPFSDSKINKPRKEKRDLAAVLTSPLVISGTSFNLSNIIFLAAPGSLSQGQYFFTVNPTKYKTGLTVGFVNCTFNITGNLLYTKLPIKFTFDGCIFNTINTTSLISLDYSDGNGCDTVNGTGNIKISNSVFTDGGSRTPSSTFA